MSKRTQFLKHVTHCLIFVILIMIYGCAPTLEKFRTPFIEGDFNRAEEIGNKVKPPNDRSFALDMIDWVHFLLLEAENGHLNFENGKYDTASTHYINVIVMESEVNPEWIPDTLKQQISLCRENYAEILFSQLSDLLSKKLYHDIMETKPDFERYVALNAGHYDDLVFLYDEAEDSIHQVETIIKEGDSEFESGIFEDAINKYREALDKGPEYAEILNLKISNCELRMQQIVYEQMEAGEAEMDNNNPDAAVEHFNKVKEIITKHPKLSVNTEKLERYLANAAAMKEEIRKKEAYEEAARADKRANGEWLGPFVIDKSRRGEEISAKGQGELKPTITVKWQGKTLIPDNDIVFFEIESNEGIKTKMFNRPGTVESSQDLIEIDFFYKGLRLWRTGDDYGKAWKVGEEKGRYFIQLTNSEPNTVEYHVECLIYDSIDR